MARFEPVVDVVRAMSRAKVVAACPSQNHTFGADARSPSASGKDAGAANSIWPRWLTDKLCGDVAASAGTFAVCRAAKVAGSYSAASPARSTQTRLFWAARESAESSTTQNARVIVLMRTSQLVSPGGNDDCKSSVRWHRTSCVQ